MTSETPTRRKKKIIRIRRKINNNNNNDNTTEAELLLQQQAILDLIRNQSLQIIASDDGTGSLEQERAATDATYRFLWSYGFDGDEMRKGWKALSQWRA